MPGDSEPRQEKTPDGYARDSRTLMEEEARVRSKFANERTFAAWIRTGLSVVVVGLAIGQFLSRQAGTQVPFLVIGGGFVVAGVGLFVFAAYDYLRSRKQMKRAQFHAPRKFLVGIALTLSLLSLALLLVLATGMLAGQFRI